MISPAAPYVVDKDTKQKLKAVLIEAFSELELKELAFDLSVDYEALEHKTKTEAAMALIDYTENRRDFDWLYFTVKQKRPKAGL